MSTITDPILQETTLSFEQLTDARFSNALDDDQKIEVLNALFTSLKSYTKDWKSHNPGVELMDNQGCPVGWDACPDGSCVPPGAGCGGGLEFIQQELVLRPTVQETIEGQKVATIKEVKLTIDQAKELLSGYITHAASTYFAFAQTEELKQQTRLLLEVAMLDFKSLTASKAAEPDLAGLQLDAGGLD